MPGSSGVVVTRLRAGYLLVVWLSVWCIGGCDNPNGIPMGSAVGSSRASHAGITRRGALRHRQAPPGRPRRQDGRLVEVRQLDGDPLPVDPAFLVQLTDGPGADHPANVVAFCGRPAPMVGRSAATPLHEPHPGWSHSHLEVPHPSGRSVLSMTRKGLQGPSERRAATSSSGVGSTNREPLAVRANRAGGSARPTGRDGGNVSAADRSRGRRAQVPGRPGRRAHRASAAHTAG